MTRKTLIWTSAALLSIVLTAALAWSASQLAGQRIGLSSEPLSALGSLAPPPAARHTAPAGSAPRPAIPPRSTKRVRPASGRPTETASTPSSASGLDVLCTIRVARSGTAGVQPARRRRPRPLRPRTQAPSTHSRHPRRQRTSEVTRAEAAAVVGPRTRAEVAATSATTDTWSLPAPPRRVAIGRAAHQG